MNVEVINQLEKTASAASFMEGIIKMSYYARNIRGIFLRDKLINNVKYT